MKKTTLYIATSKVDHLAEPKSATQKTVMISFCLPDFGALFRCRVKYENDNPLALAAIVGLRFVEVSLKNMAVKQIRLITDSPTFLIGLGNSSRLGAAPQTVKALEGYAKQFTIEPALVEMNQNYARQGVEFLPHCPTDVAPPLTYRADSKIGHGSMLPLQDGLELN